MIAEESVSIRAVVRVYNKLSGGINATITPEDIFHIASGSISGDKQAAVDSFAQFGEVAGDAVSHLLTFTDGIVVVGGGIANAHKYIFPSMLHEMKCKLGTFAGDKFPRLQMDIYDLTDEQQFTEFIKSKTVKVQIPDSNQFVNYNPVKQSGILISALGTSKAVAIGAYAYALAQLDSL